jgi:hypothetical protein
MLACKTPSSLEKGSILFSFEGVSYDDNTSSVEAHEWHVRSIQLKPTLINLGGTTLFNSSRKATFINLVSKKKGTTWVKGDWAKYIAKDYQIKFELNDRLPDGIYTTQLQAVKYAYKKQYEYIAFAKSKLAEAKSKKDKDLWSVNVADYERELVRLKSRLTKITNQNKKAYFIDN